MKLRRIQAIALGIILLLLCMTGCGRKSEDAVQQSDIEQYVSAELPEESSADRLVDGSAGDSLDANAGEPEVESVSKSYSDMTTAEKIKTLTVEGCPLSLPCRVKDMGDGFRLRDGVTDDSTLEEIVELWGEPAVRSESSLEYYDIIEETGEKRAIIGLHFFQDYSMRVYLRINAGEEKK